ncbi:MAG: phosphoenolpyruvate--protein phosphotransferase [Chloroflexi bacterium]|nr:phosphoenolpyruvate--protein phosphotransferase [Chloroflexota bacterium]
MHQGIAAAAGIAIGPAYRFKQPDLTIPEREPEPAEAEFERFTAARDQAKAELEAIRDAVAERVGDDTAAIFDAHAMLAADPSLADRVKAAVEDGQIVERAVLQVADALGDQFREMDDPYFAERGADIEDVGRRILRILLDVPDTSLQAMAQRAIVVADDLAPSDTARLNPELTLGLVTALGGTTSHSAILARTLGMPAVVGVGADVIAEIADGVTLALDGSEGTLVIDPDEDTLAEYEERRADREARLERAREFADKKAQTADGHAVEVGANISDVASAQEAVEYGAEGVGLLRTEFLYLEEHDPPSEENQMAIYRAIFETLDGRPVIVRTLDVGGDKPPSFMDFPQEMNPFLGWRAIRVSLEMPDLFRTQVRAILRAAYGHNVLVMLPFVASVTEVKEARAIFDEVGEQLASEDLDYNDAVSFGTMVETPAAALSADLIAPYVDFFSIGANDLTQYTLAADRGNERVAHLFNALSPAVLRLVRITIEHAHAHDKWVGMCGELAGDPAAIPILLGLGLDEFSMVPRAIPEAKWLLSQLTRERANAIAEHVLSLASAEEVEAYMADVLEEFGF